MDLNAEYDGFTLFDNNLVFYERLRSPDGDTNKRRLQLYKNVKRDLKTAVKHSQKNLKSNIPQVLRAQAIAEQKKEIASINMAYGVTFQPSELYDKKFYHDFKEGINFVLMGEKVYKRNMERLKYGENSTGQIDISSFLLDYVMDSIFQKTGRGKQSKIALPQKSIDKIYKNIEKKIGQNIELNTAILESFQEELYELIYNGVLKALNSEAFAKNFKNSSEINQNTSNAYKEIINFLKSNEGLEARNNLVKKIYDLLGLKEATKQFMQSQDNIQNYLKSMPTITKEDIKTKTITSKTKGTISEIMMPLIGQVISQGITSKDIKVDKQFEQTGNRNNMKADWMIAINANLDNYLDKVTASFKQVKAKTKSVRVQNMTSVQSGIDYFRKEHKDETSFITYVNAKNYTINKDFEKRGGFSAGSPTTIANTREFLSMVYDDASINKLLSALLQFGEGALGPQQYKEILLKNLAQAVAYFLFDDYKEIGNITNNSVNTVHFFWLSGQYVPFSWFLYQMADVLEKSLDNTDSIFKFTLNSPKTLYSDIDNWDELSTDEKNKMWKAQSLFALQNTTIELHFLGAFRKLMLDLEI